MTHTSDIKIDFLVVGEKIYRRITRPDVQIAFQAPYYALLEKDDQHYYLEPIPTKYGWYGLTGIAGDLDWQKCMSLADLVFYLVNSKSDETLIKFMMDNSHL